LGAFAKKGDKKFDEAQVYAFRLFVAILVCVVAFPASKSIFGFWKCSPVDCHRFAEIISKVSLKL